MRQNPPVYNPYPTYEHPSIPMSSINMSPYQPVFEEPKKQKGLAAILAKFAKKNTDNENQQPQSPYPPGPNPTSFYTHPYDQRSIEQQYQQQTQQQQYKQKTQQQYQPQTQQQQYQQQKTQQQYQPQQQAQTNYYTNPSNSYQSTPNNYYNKSQEPTNNAITGSLRESRPIVNEIPRKTNTSTVTPNNSGTMRQTPLDTTAKGNGMISRLFSGAVGSGGGILGVVNNFDKVSQLATSVLPTVQQYAPMIKNIPSVMNMFKKAPKTSTTESKKESPPKASIKKKSPKHEKTTIAPEKQTTPRQPHTTPKRKKSTPKMYI